MVGINSSIRTASTGSDGSIGLGFSIPIDGVLPIVDQIAPARRRPTPASVSPSATPRPTTGGAVVPDPAPLLGEVTEDSAADARPGSGQAMSSARSTTS